MNTRSIQILLSYIEIKELRKHKIDHTPETLVKTSIELQTMHQFKPKDEYLYAAHSAN